MKTRIQIEQKLLDELKDHEELERELAEFFRQGADPCGFEDDEAVTRGKIKVLKWVLGGSH